MATPPRRYLCTPGIPPIPTSADEGCKIAADNITQIVAHEKRVVLSHGSVKLNLILIQVHALNFCFTNLKLSTFFLTLQICFFCFTKIVNSFEKWQLGICKHYLFFPKPHTYH